ncbi:MAG: metallophosphoesterase family protein [Herpetosiphon sp.]
MQTILHLSDIHAGPPFNEDKAELVIREAAEIRPDLVVISGDLVQRADHHWHWRQARNFVERLPTPRLIVPGNHDIPQFNQVARYLRPYNRYQAYISADLEPVWECDDMVVIGVNTVRSFTVEGGKLRPAAIARLEATLRRYGTSVCKIVVMHHHVVQSPSPPVHRKDVLVGAQETLQALDRGGAELVLCGHVHTSYVGNTLEFDPTLRQGTIIAQSGTTTSRRGRLWHRGKNSFNVIEVEAAAIRISQRMYIEEEVRFMPVAEHVFPRRSSNSPYALPRPVRIVSPTTPQRLSDDPPQPLP